MAWCGEFFSQFRSFAATVDRDCSELKSEIENDEISTDGEGRSHLILRGIYADTQKLKEETLLKSSEVNKQSASFGEFLSVCERLAEHTKTQIVDLERHLTKYGYQSPGELPSVDSIHDVACKDENKGSTPTVMDTDDTLGSQDSSQSDDEAGGMETDAKSSEGGCDAQDKDQGQVQDDLMSTPVKPDTYTQMIQATPLPLSTWTGVPQGMLSTPDQSPVPPQTTTPMLKAKPGLQHFNNSILSPPSYDTPPQPLTYTPLIRANKPSGLGCGTVSSQLEDDSPLPPVLYTPGIRMMGVPGREAHGHQLNLLNEFGTPTPPDLTCTTLLKPDELGAHKTEMGSQEYFTLASISEDEYETLPGYIKAQFVADDINELLLSIEEFLKLQTEETARKTLKQNVLSELFCLGKKTKAFMLVLKKLGRADVTNGELVFATL